jgi:pectate lyase
MTVSPWNGGYCTNISLANGGSSAVTSWTLVVELGGASLTNIWGGTATTSGTQLTIKPVDYTTSIAAGASVSLGYCANTSTNVAPTLTSLTVNGGGGGTTSYALSVSKSGTGSGTVTSSPSGISCGSTCSANYASGTTVTLSASAASGSTFAGWSGACTGTGTCTASMTAARSVTATFNASSGGTTYVLSVSKSGSGSGTVTSNPSGISCGSTCSASYASGTTVTLSASAASGSTFGGWSGACTGTSTCTASMTAARSITATFNTSGGGSSGSLVGWATVGGTVTGGGSASPVTVTSLSALNSAAGGTGAAVIIVSGTISGDVTIGSNKTIQGANASATIRGHIGMKGSANVILRNLNVIGYNCTDNSDCQSGADAITVQSAAHHLWFDHLAVSDGSDGNLDLTHAVDYVTISWCKFFYSGQRSGGHQFSNLVGHSDSNASEDTGHLNITFHHCWWADNVGERMPRVRFGKVHVFNSLYTASGDNYAIASGVGANVLAENNVFNGINDPLDFSHGDSTSIGVLRGNVFNSCSGAMSSKGTAFTPPYSYSLDAASSVESAVRSGAGPR